MIRALRQHWPEYLLEGSELGIFMISAAVFTVLLEHPGSPLTHLIGDPFVRRMFIGIAMGLTAVALIFSPLDKRSGALLWKQHDDLASYSSPIGATFHGEWQVLFLTGSRLIAVSPETGAERWSYSWPIQQQANIASLYGSEQS